MPIPVEVEDVSAEWLTETLQPHAPGATVDAVEVLDRSSGTTGRARLGLVSSDDRIPPSVFVKLPPFTAERRAMVDMVGMGIAEARFYSEVASSLPVRTPPVWHSDYDADGGYIMVFEDLTTKTRQPTQDEPDAAEFAGQVLEVFAAFHAELWDSPRFDAGGDLEWIRARTRGTGSDAAKQIMRKGIADFGDEMPEVFHQLADVFLNDAEGLNRVLEEGTHTLIHGDCHIGNMLRDENGPIVLDWAMVRYGLGLRDVAYFIGNSIPQDIRKDHEQELLARYLTALDEKGVHLPFDEAWDTYRLQLITGWISAVTTTALGSELQPLEVGMRATHRSNAAIEELDVVALLHERLG